MWRSAERNGIGIIQFPTTCRSMVAMCGTCNQENSWALGSNNPAGCWDN